MKESLSLKDSTKLAQPVKPQELRGDGNQWMMKISEGNKTSNLNNHSISVGRTGDIGGGDLCQDRGRNEC